MFRTLTIPLSDLKFTSGTQNYKGLFIHSLHVEDPDSEREIVVRSVGVDTIVLKATLQEAVRRRPCGERY